MRVAHIAVVTPGRCGLYETTRELVAGLRARGVDSRIVEPSKNNTLHPGGTEDRSALFADAEWASECDVVVAHSGTNGLEKTKPIIYVAHGRPRSSFLIEKNGGTAVYSYNYRQNTSSAIKKVVTFWPEHVPFLKVMMPDKDIEVVQACVDLERWTPDGARHNFSGLGGRINVVCSDPWRDDVDPYYPLNAFALWAREMREARFHLYGTPRKARRGWSALIKRVKDDGNMGEVRPWVKDLGPVYRSADFVLTGNEIDVRTVREATACGCPVVRVGSNLNGYRTEIAKARDLSRTEVRARAVASFDPAETARQFHAVLEAVA